MFGLLIINEDLINNIFLIYYAMHPCYIEMFSFKTPKWMSIFTVFPWNFGVFYSSGFGFTVYGLWFK